MEEDDRGQGPVENSLECPAVEDEDDDDGFSFPVLPLAADACIVPVYPIFGRPTFPAAPAAREEEEDEPETATLRVPLGRLLLEEREFRARQQDDRSVSARQRHHEEEKVEDDDGGADEELEGVPPESYCLWAPGGHASSAPASPRRCRKSGSTGSVLRWRRISDRLVGRSHSDGKEKFVFLNSPGALPPGPGPANKQDEQVGGKGDAAAGLGRSLRYYSKGGGAGGSGRRQSYLPYKQELVGLFANVSGLRRSYHPF